MRCFVVALVLTIAGRVRAQTCDESCRTQARQLFEQGVESLETNADRAAELLRQSLELLPTPPTAYNLAQALQRADRPADAAKLLERLLTNQFGSLSDEERAATLFARDALRRRIATLRISLDGPDEAEARLDDVLIGVASSLEPTSFVLNPVAGTLELRTDGYRVHRQRVPLRPGETLVLHVAMQELELTTVAERPAPKRRRTGLWVGLGTVALVALAVGLGFALADRGSSDPTWGRARVGLTFD